MDQGNLRQILLDRSSGGIDASYYGGIVYELYHCPACDHYYQTYLPTVAGFQSLSSHISEHSQKRKDVVNVSNRNLREIELISILLNTPKKDVTILEFGSGWGLWLRMATTYGYQTTGVEILEDRANFARHRELRIVSTLDHITDHYDFVYADQVLEHLNEPLPTVKRLAQALAPHGIMHIAVPDGDLAKKDFAQLNPPVKAIFPFEHVQCFTHRSLIKLASYAGLEPIPWTYIARRLLGRVTLSDNLHYTQEAVKIIRRQYTGTNMYFRKKEN